MGLPIFDDPPTPPRTSKTTADPTAHARTTIRRPTTRERRSRRFDEVVSGSAARALDRHTTLHRTDSVHRTSNYYTVGSPFDSSFGASSRNQRNDGNPSAESSRPRSRRGPPSPLPGTSRDDGSELHPPLRRMPGHDYLRSTESLPSQPMPSNAMNGLGDRERSVSVDPADTDNVPPIPAVSERVVPTAPDLMAWSDSSILDNMTLEGPAVLTTVDFPPSSSRAFAPPSLVRGTMFRPAIDPDILVCDESLELPAIDNRAILDESSESRSESTPNMQASVALQESATYIRMLDERFQNSSYFMSTIEDRIQRYRTAGRQVAERMVILRQLEHVAEELGRQERCLRTSLEAIRQERQNWENRSRGSTSRSINAPDLVSQRTQIQAYMASDREEEEQFENRLDILQDELEALPSGSPAAPGVERARIVVMARIRNFASSLRITRQNIDNWRTDLNRIEEQIMELGRL